MANAGREEEQVEANIPTVHLSTDKAVSKLCDEGVATVREKRAIPDLVAATTEPVPSTAALSNPGAKPSPPTFAGGGDDQPPQMASSAVPVSPSTSTPLTAAVPEGQGAEATFVNVLSAIKKDMSNIMVSMADMRQQLTARIDSHIQRVEQVFLAGKVLSSSPSPPSPPSPPWEVGSLMSNDVLAYSVCIFFPSVLIRNLAGVRLSSDQPAGGPIRSACCP